ncbi:MAG: hypothetical protein U0903_12735 [Planctomycetales bacterium]
MKTPRQGNLFAEEKELSAWEAADQADRLLAEVVFNIPVNTLFHYLIPDHLRDQVKPGARLKLPFGRGNQLQVGYCVGTRRFDEAFGERPPEISKIKEVFEVVDEAPLVNGGMLELTRWIADYYLCGWGQVLESVIPAGVKRTRRGREW